MIVLFLHYSQLTLAFILNFEIFTQFRNILVNRNSSGVANQDGDKEFHQTFKKAILETFFFTPVERHDRTLRNRQVHLLVGKRIAYW